MTYYRIKRKQQSVSKQTDEKSLHSGFNSFLSACVACKFYVVYILSWTKAMTKFCTFHVFDADLIKSKEIYLLNYIVIVLPVQ